MSSSLGLPQLNETVDAVLKGGSVSAGARLLGLNRRTVQHRLDAAKEAGLIGERGEANASRWRPGEEIAAAHKETFKRVRASAAGLGGNVIHLPDEQPFMVIAFGDPHWDNPGTDLALFEWWASFLDREKRRTGALMGDLLDNWVRAIAHLYAYAETPAPEGWVLAEHYLDRLGPHLDASVGGNHDDWNGHSDVLGRMMRDRGVLHRSKSLRYAYRTPAGRELTFRLRHKWKGHSQWNEVHGIKKAARQGIRDTVLLGGHTHVSGDSIEKDPMTGKLTWCIQTASFKVVDEYVDELGLDDRQISPAVALVCDPRLSDTDPELVKVFHNPERASLYLKALSDE